MHFFYAYDALIASTQLEWLQEAFNALIGVFDLVGFSTNVGKMVRIIFHPCHVVGTHSDMAYKRTIMGEGLTYWSHQKQRVRFPECAADLAAIFLAAHHQTQHGIGPVYHCKTPMEDPQKC